MFVCFRSDTIGLTRAPPAPHPRHSHAIVWPGAIHLTPIWGAVTERPHIFYVTKELLYFPPEI